MFFLLAYQHCCSCAAGFQAIFGLPLLETSAGMISTNMHDLPETASVMQVGLHDLAVIFGDLNLCNQAYACCTLCCGSRLLWQQVSLTEHLSTCEVWMCVWSEALHAAVSRQLTATHAAAIEPNSTSLHAFSGREIFGSQLSIVFHHPCNNSRTCLGIKFQSVQRMPAVQQQAGFAQV